MNTNEHEEEKKTAQSRFFILLRSYSCSFVSIHGYLSCLILFASGCLLSNAKPTTMPLSKIDPVQATPDYWWNQPAVVQVQNTDFQKLWDACKGELYVRLFTVDREQYRDGILTSEPMVSKQFFELWRDDTSSVHDTAESSLATIRRTVRFEVVRLDDGSYQATPKVLVERFDSAERRLTAITQYHSAFSGPRATVDSGDQSGQPIASDYWYPVRRDTDLEKQIADSIRQRVGQ
jgi:hypothetical protein